MAKNQKKQKQELIDKYAFEMYCNHQCTEKEIASYFHVSIDTIIRWCKETYGKSFNEVFAELRSTGHLSLRSQIWQDAMKGNTTLQIFLAKNYLGMSDRVENYNEEKVVIVNDLKEDEC